MMQIDTDNRIVGFEEKPSDPKTIPGDDEPLPRVDGHLRLHRAISVRATLPGRHTSRSTHDFGRDHDSVDHRRHRVFAFPFRDENRKGDAYWRDVGTLDAYFEANMDLITSIRCSICTTNTGPCAPTNPTCRRRSSSSAEGR